MSCLFFRRKYLLQLGSRFVREPSFSSSSSGSQHTPPVEYYNGSDREVRVRVVGVEHYAEHYTDAESDLTRVPSSSSGSESTSSVESYLDIDSGVLVG